VHVGVEAVAQQLRESLELSTRMSSSKLDGKDLDLASQVRRAVVPKTITTCMHAER
jgi:hypothetical protein